MTEQKTLSTDLISLPGKYHVKYEFASGVYKPTISVYEDTPEKSLEIANKMLLDSLAFLLKNNLPFPPVDQAFKQTLAEALSKRDIDNKT